MGSHTSAIMPNLSSEVERALERCGRDRVMHNDGSPPMVAIRMTPSPFAMPSSDKWLTAEGANHDEAGAKVARMFAEMLRRRGEALIQWADKIQDELPAWGRGDR